MPTASNIVLNDGQATPVAHTFVPLGKDSVGAFWFEDQSAAYTLGNPRISIQLVRPSLGGQNQSSGARVNRVKWAVHVPALETLGTADNGITPPPTLAYIGRSMGEFIMSERMSAQARKDLRIYTNGLMTHTGMFVPVIESLVPIFG